ncbi:excinuclease ABC subunit UvrC [Fluviibacter phosphoraccumulans]|uniref:excinuclease ABC subunit UvrC n=1 Tax=Fluviibacter phosphoraccumulans TaxID=1751046 RepID=UPI0024E215C6|nr:excinuclease ABC subunit UvrC [Fluviibacter phosphoraccumulans]
MSHPLQDQVRTLPERPGVYRFLAEDGQVLYVGKARNLKSRVSSYFAKNLSSPRIALMVSKVASLMVTPTPSESEALLLENHLIKELAPKYNILFRDDKSYPYIRLTRETWPLIGLHRGSLSNNADYFGPYPNAYSVREAVHLLQKIFRLRTCEDSVFNNRTRPCLLHQIKRCSGPCVGRISQADYAEDVKAATMFLQGRHQEIMQRLTALMEQAADKLAFEQAAQFRDQIQALHHAQDTQIMDSHQAEDVDIIVAVEQGGSLCVNLAMVRGGRHLGDRALFPQAGNQLDQASLSEVLSAFIESHYAQHPPPGKVLVNVSVDEAVAETLAGMIGRPLPMDLPYYAQHKSWVELAINNAQLALTQRRRMQSLQGQRQASLLAALQQAGLPVEQLNRIECFDISHTQGEAAVASCVVWTHDEKEGGAMRRADYRRFNITDITPGDDYAAIHQAVYRRYKPNEKAVEGMRPDLVLIDGGKGQVAKAAEALAELGRSDIPLVGVAKGLGRKPGLESLIFTDDRAPLHLDSDDPGLHLVQEIRDEAHRFALTGHRGRRQKARFGSRLDDIAGIGPKRRKALMTCFGSVSAMKVASIDAIANVPGMSAELAQRVHEALQDS